MDQPFFNHQTRTGAIGGTLFCLLAGNICSADLYRTAILAATGALVSCCVSILFRWLLRYGKKP